jgi:GNAT superfamily N-acetyltransferase
VLPTNPVLFRAFEPGDEAAFRDLNLAWIEQFFSIEEKDKEVLGDPVGQILRPGGAILMAVADGQTIGCCALLRIADGFELGKMAVAEGRRGSGVGKQLLAHAINFARQTGARRLYLETSTKLPNAIHLYESQGFRRLPAESVQRSPYLRSNVYMEMFLKGG